MSNLTDQQKLELSSAGFTDREITLYRQKFYSLLNTQPIPRFDVMKNLEGFRDQRDELLAALKIAQAALAHCKADVGYSSKQTAAAIAINAAIVNCGGAS